LRGFTRQKGRLVLYGLEKVIVKRDPRRKSAIIKPGCDHLQGGKEKRIALSRFD